MAFLFITKMEFHSSVIFVEDIKVSKKFYCDILNQEIETDFGNNVSLKNGLSLWEIPKTHMLNNSFYQKGNTNQALELYFETENIDAVVDLIKKNKISKHHDLIEESWGQKTIRVYDPDQNLIEIGEKLEIFIRRMLESGLNTLQIYQKTGVPEDLIKKLLK